jgi:hypothetical protein
VLHNSALVAARATCIKQLNSIGAHLEARAPDLHFSICKFVSVIG